MSRVDLSSGSQSSDLEGAFVCISDGHLLISALDETIKMVPRRISVNGNPTRLAYSAHLNKLIVGLDTIDDTTEELNLKTGTIGRFIRPTLTFVDPDQTHLADEDAQPLKLPYGQTGERITSLITWNPTDGRKKYEMIIIATCIDDPDTDTSDGRMIFISPRPSQGEGQQIEAKVKYTYKHEKRPIYSMASYGASSLAFCAGKLLVLQTFDMQTREWRHNCEYTLPSPGVATSVHVPYIYVTTAHHSLMIFSVVDDDKRLVPQAHDKMSRPGLHHLAIPEAEMAVTSSRGGTAVGISTVAETASPVLFEANLPVSITRLREAAPQTTKGSHGRVLYGSTIDGTLYHFTTLNLNEWRLLRFVQIICLGEPLLFPFSRRKVKLPAKIEPSQRHPEAMHIDGDMLCRLLDLGVDGFKDMLLRGPSSDDSMDADEVVAHFRQLAEVALGASNDYAVDVMNWIRKILNIAI